jgi:hypothetical protein
MRELLIGELAPAHEQDGKARRKVKAKTNDEGEGNINPPPPKMKSFWKMKKWFKIEDNLAGHDGRIKGIMEIALGTHSRRSCV